jgi:hypothetical protein
MLNFLTKRGKIAYKGFELSWFKDESDQSQLCYFRQNSPAIITFYEHMLHQIALKLELIEFSPDKSTKPYSDLLSNIDYPIGVLLIGDIFKQLAKYDGFVCLKRRSNLFASLNNEPKISASAIIFVDSNDTDPIFLLKNNCNPEILVIVGHGWKDKIDPLFCRCKCVIEIDTIDEISQELCRAINLLVSIFAYKSVSNLIFS